MEAAAVQKLQRHYYRKAVGAVALALVGYCLLTLYLQWFCPRFGAFCWCLGRLWSGSLSEGAFWLGYRNALAELTGNSLYFALSQLILIPVCMTAAGWKCRRDAGAAGRPPGGTWA